MGAEYKFSFAAEETLAIVLLFMNREAVSWFEKGGVPFKGEKKAVAGPVGALTEGQKAQLAGVHIIAYAYYCPR